MKERPILFSAPMVRALLDGSKTQTRRIVKPQPECPSPETAWTSGDGHSGSGWYAHHSDYPEEGSLFYRCPYGQPGDQLWVRETWNDFNGVLVTENAPIEHGRIYYAADTGYTFTPHRPSIFMPRAASRITLEITGVRVERVQDISDKDVAAEGTPGMIAGRYQCSMCNGQGANLTWPTRCPHCNGTGNNHAEKYRALWDSINAKRAPWASNPWVWVLEFKRVKP